MVNSPRLFVIADVGGPAHYHLGDEAMLEANLDAFRELVPGLQFTVLSADPAWTARRYGVESFSSPGIPTNHSPESWMHAAAEIENRSTLWSEWLGPEIGASLKSSVGLVVSGGGNLCATWPAKILERVALLELARAFAIPAVVLGQTIGPKLSPDQRTLLTSALAASEWIGVRDESSGALALSLGVSAARIHRQLDDAFFLAPEPVEDERAKELREGRRPWMIVTLDASFAAPERERSLSVLASQLDALADCLQATLVVVPHVGAANAGVPDGLSDAPAGRALAARMRSKLILLDPWQPREVRWLIEQAAMVISTRYHGLVFASAAGVPSLGLSVDDYTRVKLRGALAAAGLEGWCIGVADLERGAFLPLARELWHHRDSVSEKLARLRVEAWPEEVQRREGICQALRLKPEAIPQRPQPPHRSQTPRAVTPNALTVEQWNEYEDKGYLRLGSVLDQSGLAALRERMDAIMLGRVRYPTLQMQLDTGGAYEELPDPVEGLPAATLAYRKIQGLEADPLVLDLVRRDLFREICARHYGAHVSISIFRVMMMNKPSGKGTYLPWHQDAGDVWKLDRDPLVTSWIALDAATRQNGCVQVIPGSHRLGLLSKNGSTLSAESVRRFCSDERVEYLELDAGEGLLLHNWLLHRSDINHTGTPRRALSVCYMDGRTLGTLTGERYPIVFGEHEDAESALSFVRGLKADNRQLLERAQQAEEYANSVLKDNRLREQMRSEAERYALSLLEDNQRREEMRRESERYALSLEAELERIRGKAASARP